MNSGFSNLAFLKQQLLAKSFSTDTRFDTLIQAIGLGVAGQFARYCNRDWMYQTNIAEINTGDRSFWFVRSAPVTQFIAVNLRFFRTDAWVSILSQPLQADEEKGLIHFGYTLGVAPIQFQIIYNGGYWWEQLEPDDAAYPSAVPADIANNAAGIDPNKFMLPAELQLAWLLQCKHVWSNQDKLGTDVLKSGKDASIRFPVEWAPTVEQTLQGFRRYQIT